MIKWTDDLIEKSIREAMNQLNINRMPTGDELKEIEMNALHCKISRTKKYSGWAAELGIDLKSGSSTREGTKYENMVMKWLESKGFNVVSTSHKHPFDLQVNGCVKIDVKVSSPYTSKNGTKYIFSGMKGVPTCDIYVLVTLHDTGHIKNFFIIPSHLIQQHTINFKEEDFEKYNDGWMTIYKYMKFFKSFV